MQVTRARSILLTARLNPCHHRCKYCQVGQKKLAHVPATRFLQFAERFLEWQYAHAPDLDVGYMLNYTFDYDRDTLRRLHDLKTRFAFDYPPLRSMLLGGLPWRPDEALRSWLIERQEFGLTNVHATLAGVDATHDYWNGRPGNFELLMRTLRMAKDLGMSNATRLFVTRSTLPRLEELRDRLDQLPSHPRDRRYTMPFFYAGWSTRHETERIDEDIRDNLPQWVRALARNAAEAGEWRSEREWVAHIRERPEPEVHTKLYINVADDNIDRARVNGL